LANTRGFIEIESVLQAIEELSFGCTPPFFPYCRKIDVVKEKCIKKQFVM